MKEEIKGWKVGVSYERYGYIHVSPDEAATEEEAVAAAQKKLEAMGAEELDRITEYMQDSEAVDPEGVLRM